MDKESQDQGIATVIVERMQELRLPRALDLKAKVDAGGVLDDLDIDFLEKVFADSNEFKQLLAPNPDYEELAGRMMALYHDITTKAMENEQKQA